MPEQSLADYELHAKAICEYAVILRKDRERFLENVRLILRRLSDIQIFASCVAEQFDLKRNKDVEKALKRMAKGYGFGGYFGPDASNVDWKPPESSDPVVVFVRSVIDEVREAKAQFKDYSC